MYPMFCVYKTDGKYQICLRVQNEYRRLLIETSCLVLDLRVVSKELFYLS